MAYPIQQIALMQANVQLQHCNFLLVVSKSIFHSNSCIDLPVISDLIGWLDIRMQRKMLERNSCMKWKSIYQVQTGKMILAACSSNHNCEGGWSPNQMKWLWRWLNDSKTHISLVDWLEQVTVAIMNIESNCTLLTDWTRKAWFIQSGGDGGYGCVDMVAAVMRVI